MIKNFLEKTVEEGLGVSSPLQYYHPRDFSALIADDFAGNIGIWRVHYYLMEILNVMINEDSHLFGVCCMVQLAKACHQAALSGGRWKVAAKMLPFRNPWGRPIFAGNFQELQLLADHGEAVDKLLGTGSNNKWWYNTWDPSWNPVEQADAQPQAGGDDAPAPKAKGKAKGKGKGRNGRKGKPSWWS